MISRTTLVAPILIIALGLACGDRGYEGADLAPMNKDPSTPGGPLDEVRFVLMPEGLNVSSATVRSGARVVFLNEDVEPHQPASNPHPTHSLCPELNLSELSPGQEATVTIEGDQGICGFHDHLDPNNVTYYGSIEVESGA